MRVVVVGASGNVGTSLLRALANEPAVDSILGLARRIPKADFPKTEWRQADIARSPLRPHFDGADAVAHLAWLIQPGRDKQRLYEVNVEGSGRVFRAAAWARVGSLVYASSVGAYAPGPKDRRVDESWPTTGLQSSFYSRHKAEVERLLDRFEEEHPDTRVVRLRPGLIFKREAASGIRRLFAGPLLPSVLVQRRLIPAVPAHPRLAFQAVHSYDVGDAYRLALVRGHARGAFKNTGEAGRGPGGLAVPLMDVTRARSELGWSPQRSASEALLDLLEGMREGAGLDTPPLEPGGAGPLRAREFASGVGAPTASASPPA